MISVKRVSGLRCHVLLNGHRIKTIHCGTGTEPRVVEANEFGYAIEANWWVRGKKVRERRYFYFKEIGGEG